MSLRVILGQAFGAVAQTEYTEGVYHAIENTANQNTGKPLYIRWYSTQPSHCAPELYSQRNLVSVFFMAWYKNSYTTLSCGMR